MADNYFDKKFKYKKKLAAHEESINTMGFSPSGHFLATAGDDKKLIITNILSKNFRQKETIETPHTESIFELDYAMENQLYTCGSDGLLCSFDLNRSICKRTYNSHKTNLKVSLSAEYDILSVSTNEDLLFYDERVSFRPINSLNIRNAKMEFRPNSLEFVVGSMNKIMQLYDFRNTENPLVKYKLTKGLFGITNCVFNKAGSLILVTEHGKGPAIYRTDFPNMKAQLISPQFKNMVTYKTFKFGGPNDSFVLAGTDDKKVYYWRIAPSEESADYYDLNEIEGNGINKKQTNFSDTLETSYCLYNKKLLELKNENYKNKEKMIKTESQLSNNMIVQRPEVRDNNTNGLYINIIREQTTTSLAYFHSSGTTRDVLGIIKQNFFKEQKKRNCFYIDNHEELTGFRSIINMALMHPTIPLIFCSGIENCIYACSPFYKGKDENICENYDSILFGDSWLEETYGNA